MMLFQKTPTIPRLSSDTSFQSSPGDYVDARATVATAYEYIAIVIRTVRTAPSMGMPHNIH